MEKRYPGTAIYITECVPWSIDIMTFDLVVVHVDHCDCDMYIKTIFITRGALKLNLNGLLLTSK